jgi:hypothetical protein
MDGPYAGVGVKGIGVAVGGWGVKVGTGVWVGVTGVAHPANKISSKANAKIF